MSSLEEVGASNDSGAVMEGNKTCQNRDLQNIEEHSDDEVAAEQGFLSSSTNSDSTTFLRTVKSALELPAKRKSLERSNPIYCRTPHGKRHSKTSPHRKPPIKPLTYNRKFNVDHKTLEVVPDSSTEDIPRDCLQIQDVGKVNSQDPFIASLYITSYNILDGHLNMQIPSAPFVDTISNIVSGKVRVQKTFCGIIVAFTKEEDVEKIMRLPLQRIFGGPIQVVRFQKGEYRFRQNVIIKDVPWCISNLEIHQALKMQGISAGKVTRIKNHVKIETANALDTHRLNEEGLNFFNYTFFPAVLESSMKMGEPDIIQCFKCQGFWHTSTHCRQMPRCVRCGENHEVEYCPRPRNAPICCHCGGPHHASYKMCPVRLQHINSTNVGFQLAKSKPIRSFPHMF